MDKSKEYVICMKMRQTDFCEYLRQDPYGRNIKTAASNAWHKKATKGQRGKMYIFLKKRLITDTDVQFTEQ